MSWFRRRGFAVGFLVRGVMSQGLSDVLQLLSWEVSFAGDFRWRGYVVEGFVVGGLCRRGICRRMFCQRVFFRTLIPVFCGNLL